MPSVQPSRRQPLHASVCRETLDWPLMQNNIAREDLDAVVDLLQTDDPILTNGPQVREFEAEWSAWLGSKYSVMVNSGSSANLLSMTALRELRGRGQVIVPPLTWVSDIAAVLQCGFEPVFVDIDLKTLAMDPRKILESLHSDTKAVFLTHILGYNGLSQELLDELAARDIPLIEDVCESHGATMGDRKLGTFGWMSNFSFYYAHHLSTIEGGMISTDDPDLYEMLRMLRSHGMVRESRNEELKQSYLQQYPDLNPSFIFAFPGYNFRSTEINAVIGRSQLKRLDDNNLIRSRNLQIFLDHLDSTKYYTEFNTTGSSNYALTLVVREPDLALAERVMQALDDYRVEYRRGTSGGGNQLRQPYLKRLLGDQHATCPVADHVHFFGFYIGNYPTLEPEKIHRLCEVLNGL